MDFEFTNNFRAVKSFNWINVPDFVVLTGVNGSGKSQLLSLLYQNTQNRSFPMKINISGASFDPHEVILRTSEWSITNTEPVGLENIQKEDTNIHQQLLTGRFKLAKSELATKTNQLVINVFKKTGKSDFKQIAIEELDEVELLKVFERDNSPIQNINLQFLRYKLLYLQRIIDKKTEEEINNELGVPPWITLREIIYYANLPFEINEPGTNIKHKFKLTIRHKILNKEINFQELSSGEKVIFSLVLLRYNTENGIQFPKLLLLDEPDAHLHPSIIPNFMNVLQEVLVKKYGVKIIMTTHSATTVAFAPIDSLFEKCLEGEQIRKINSTNQAVSILTSGLVFVDKNTKYIFVEAEDDVDFYTIIHKHLVKNGEVSDEVPLLFIDSKTKGNTGCYTVVCGVIERMQPTGFKNQIHGLVDWDGKNNPEPGVFILNRYCIENYYSDPILLYMALLKSKRQPNIPGISFEYGDEPKILDAPTLDLQKIVDAIVKEITPYLSSKLQNFDAIEDILTEDVELHNGIVLQYPKWLLKKSGKKILNMYFEIYGQPIHRETLSDLFYRFKLIPKELTKKLEEIKKYGIN